VAYGILLLRLVLGLTVAGHGAQKLLGWFGGPGPQGVGGFMASLRFRTPFLTGLLLGTSELAGGALLATGLLVPFAALLVTVVMANAIVLVHRRNGFWNSDNGLEFPLLVWAGAVALAAVGGGRFSLDAAFGWADTLSGVWWGVGVAAVGALCSLLTLTLWRRRPGAPAVPEVEPQVRRAA